MSSFSLPSAASGGIVSILENASVGPANVRRASMVDRGSSSGNGRTTTREENSGQLRSAMGDESGGSASNTPNGESSNGGAGSDFFGSGDTGRSSSATSADESSSVNGYREVNRKRSVSGQLEHQDQQSDYQQHHRHHTHPTHTQIEPGATLPHDQPRNRAEADAFARGHSNPIGLEGQQLLQDDSKFVASPTAQKQDPFSRCQDDLKHVRTDHQDPNQRIKRRDSSPRQEYQYEGGWQSARQGHASAYPDQQQVETSPPVKKGRGSLKIGEPPIPAPTRRAEIVPLSASSKARPLDNLESEEPSPKRAKPQILPDGKKRYPCQHPGCDKTFSTSGHAARHNRIHTGAKPYRCTFPGCAARFSRQDNSLQHYRTHLAPSKGSGPGAQEAEDDSESAKLCRKALEEGTAIEVVREVVDSQGKTKGETVQKTVGLPGAGGKTVASSEAEALAGSPSVSSVVGDDQASGDAGAETTRAKGSQKPAAAPKKRGRKSKKEIASSTSVPRVDQQPSGQESSSPSLAVQKDKERVGTPEDFEMEIDDKRDATAAWSRSQYRQATSGYGQSPALQWSTGPSPSYSTPHPSFTQSQLASSLPQNPPSTSNHARQNAYDQGVQLNYGLAQRRISLSGGQQICPTPSSNPHVSHHHQHQQHQYQSSPAGGSWPRHHNFSNPPEITKSEFTFQPSIAIHAQSHSRRSSANGSPIFGGGSSNGVFEMSPLSNGRRPSLLSSLGITNNASSTMATTSTPPALSAKHPYSSDRSTT